MCQGFGRVGIQSNRLVKLFDGDIQANFEKLRQFGNGLKNMQKRMEDIQINFSIENNNGTLITLHRVIENF